MRVCSLILVLAALTVTNTEAGNLYNGDSGILQIPVLVAGNKTYSATFARIGTNPLRWGSTSIKLVSADSRAAAVYDAATERVWVPEVNFNGRLYSLYLDRTYGCGHAACLEADLSTVQALGRDGAQLFTSALSSASTFSCSSCHAVRETDGFAGDGLRRPGHPLLNAPNRSSFKNGLFTEMLDAVNTCLTEWMNTSAWTETDTNWINLRNWLQDQSDDDDPEEVTISIVDPPENLSGGDTAAGQQLFNKSCSVCHGENGGGTSLAPRITETGLEPNYIARRIRTSGLIDSGTYAGLTGGIMPFWGADRLSDAELLDIVAYVAAGDDMGPMPGGGNPGSGSTCDKTHPRVGQTATLSEDFHSVAGTAVIVDDCTIQLVNFSYDGGGILVLVYLAQDNNFVAGFGLGSDLVGTAFSDATLTLTLPEGKTLDDFNSISIWCVAVGISFGDGVFN